MMRELYDLASGMRKLSSLHQTYQDSMERTVLDALTDYSGIIHTLPMLVRLHEDAMETYNASKEKDTVSTVTSLVGITLDNFQKLYLCCYKISTVMYIVDQVHHSLTV